ncbi:MAG TPA: DUF3301 domain-containing protein [Gammaproteobacteria bacterium]|nr:DUF3301 domain-containing protein [Gammaproteobacteria bacterium]
MYTLSVILALLVLIWLWHVGQSSRDKAIATAIDTCRKQGIQFLDGTAALQSLRPAWSRSEGPVLQRTYTFDYSDNGIDRRTGCIIMRNIRVVAVLLDA